MTAREVELTGGAPWGFRMHGGADHNQPLRISRVNPGRKASLSGIREGDVISSINGRPTKGMSNADAHAMLRGAGPVLKLGLNENREMSPRRRSIGKSSELKRPSQLIAEVQGGRATPQAPVYATIRPSQLPQNRPSSLSAQSSLNSLPAALSSTPLVKSVTTNDEPLRFHPTNPFYTTLPNYSSASKLPVPNGRASSIDRSKSKENTSSLNDQSSDLKSPSFFNKSYDSGPSSLPHSNYKDTEYTNGFDSTNSKYANDKSANNSYDSKFNSFYQSVPNETRHTSKNPFETKRNSDPFEKYLRPDSKMNGNNESSTIINSHSDNNFHKREEISKHSLITEHEVKEIEEVKTIKKIVLNGSSNSIDHEMESKFNTSSIPGTNGFNTRNTDKQQENSKKERIFNIPIQRDSDYFNSRTEKGRPEERTHSNLNQSTPEEYSSGSPAAEASSRDVLAGKPPARSPVSAAPLTSPANKRKLKAISKF